MQSSNHIKQISRSHRAARSALSATITAILGVYGATTFAPVHAQATTGTIFGSAPAGSGETIQITGGAGFNRTIPVDSSGHYSVTVPVGSYSVSLLQNGAVVQSHNNVSPSAGGASEADFAQPGGGSANAQNLGTVTVTANALPAIDVTSTNQNLTITSKQLTQLPLPRNAEAIALLAPGTTPGAAMFAGSGPTGGSPISFGGSSIVENAYYINGFNTSDPLSNTGGIALPYGAIDQQQTLTSGYGAMYGRSAGGVISQVGKSGTNDWHFGGQVLWSPEFAQNSFDNFYYSNPRCTGQCVANDGQLFQYRKGDSSWNTVYDAYLGGPLIKDKLFLFVAAEAEKTQTTTVGNVNAGNVADQRTSNPKYYLKLDWNINDSNILSLTDIYNSNASNPAEFYSYDSTTHERGAFESLGQETKNSFNIWIAKYTSYITDNLTLNFLYGKMDGKYYVNQPPYPGYDASEPNIISSSQENPAYMPNGNPAHSGNFFPNINNASHKSEVRNLRLDLDWKLGNHDLQFGIDNDDDADFDDGLQMTGPGYAWLYGNTGTPGQEIIPGSIGPVPNGGTYYVSRYVFSTFTSSLRIQQRAQYIQDNWQVTPNLLLNLGLRNDQFTNYNPEGEAFLRLTKPQWAPRIGFSWDVFGDSTMKVFGNAGRYYLAMPVSVALREASYPLYSETFYGYTGIGSDGIPTGLVPVQANNTYYVNGENGELINPKTAASGTLKAEYQDQFVLGMQQQINPSWVYGATGIVNKLGRIIDDFDPQAYEPQIAALAAAQGQAIDPSLLSGSVLINPGSTAILTIPNGIGGYSTVKMPGSVFNYPPAKRHYYSLELYLEHPFDGKWFGKIDYVFSRSYGDTEGPVQSNIGQGGSSQSGTEQWDFWQIMQYANGDQANDQKHQLRIYGSYAITPEWTVGGTYRIASGTPESCLGYYGPSESNYQNYAQFGGAYHWCGGVPTPPGSTGFTPWTHQLNLQLDYRPAFAQHKLDFQLQIHNVFNEQSVTQIIPAYGKTAAPLPTYLLPAGMEAPRYVQFGITYDY
ncbi:TonB-dependent receptor plug domain-containing protein [Rhodanobacter hydrolyticus]|uniref:TonB-dependent receptor n=1 Tax=Rhodanobacter hydrolyticus TaxID=2250595 RepID=A0ABW8J895_9GAMM